MIKLGFPQVSLYPDSGMVFENHGGTIVFHGSCRIGNNSAISVGPKALVDFEFKPSTPLREGLRRFAEWYANRK